MIEGLSPIHLVLVLAIALIVIGPGKLPEVGGAIGKSIREFRKASSGDDDQPAQPAAAAPAPAPVAQPVAQVPAPAAPVVAAPAPVAPAAPAPVESASTVVTPAPAPVDPPGVHPAE